MKKTLPLSIVAATIALAILSPSVSAQNCSIHGAPLVIQSKRIDYSRSHQRVPQTSRAITSMVNQLRGAAVSSSRSSQSRQNLVNRSIKLNSQAMPKGYSTQRSARNTSAGASRYPQGSYDYGYQTDSHAGHDHGSELSYRVDQSCQLCTNEIKFLKNSTRLADSGSRNYLMNLAYALQDPALAHERFVIEGHASAEGSYSSNQVLSQRRANAIFDFLVSQGVHPARLFSVGHGEAQARYASNSPEHLRSSDRRVMVFKMAL